MEHSADKERLGIALLKDVGSCFLVAVVLTAIATPWIDWNPARLGNWLFANFVISLGIGMTISNLYRFAMPPLLRRWRGSRAEMACHIGFGLVGVVVGGEIAFRILGLVGFQTSSGLRAGIFQVGLVVVIVVTSIAVGYERLKERARRTEMREQEAQQRALRAELQALQARTDPHFLFNTLNTVAGLVEEDPPAAERMLEKLSTVFRYALEGSDNRWVRLEEEWQAIGDYLEVERIRFGDRLRVTQEMENGVGTTLVPPLILQPVVENAVLHGIAGQVDGGTIDVRARRTDGAVELTVQDNGPGPGNSRHSGSGQGLNNLRERLQLVYDDRATLTMTAGDGGGCLVTLRLPERATEDEA